MLTEIDLRPGDVLMIAGNDITSDLARMVDGGRYSHTAIYDGEAVIECHLSDDPEKESSGVQQTHLSVFLRRTKDPQAIDVFRFCPGPDVALGDPELPSSPVLDVAHKYLADKTGYASSHLWWIAVLVLLRRNPTFAIDKPWLRHILQMVLDYLHGKAEKQEKVKEIVCSEFVYRCFQEADSSELTQSLSYTVQIKPTLITPEFDVRCHGEIEMLAENKPDKVTNHCNQLVNEIQEFLWENFPAIRKAIMANNDAIKEHGFIDWRTDVVPQVVMPSDLERSINLNHMGRFSPVPLL